MKAIRLFLVSTVCMVAFCSANGETVSGTENGHDYVDLGLPSGTLWATCNVGANAPEEYGDYYAWGETKTRTRGVDSKKTYKYAKPFTKDFDDATYYGFTKYCTKSEAGYNGFTDNKTVLDPEDDVAHVKWGGGWKIPTYDEVMELWHNCTWTWVTYKSIKGLKVTGSNGNTMFLPWINYWSSTLYNDPSEAYTLADGVASICSRFSTSPVRPVCSK